jgi:hypothetical protein
MLLASSRSHCGELGLYTLRIPDANGARDVYVAEHIAHRLGLEHESIRMIKPDPADLELWSYRSGCLVGEPRGRQATTTLRSLDRTRVRFNGQVGDLLRAPNRVPGDTEDTVIGVERVAIQSLSEAGGADFRTKLSPGQRNVVMSPMFLERAERWLAGLGDVDAFTVIDVNYLESCIAPWAGPWAYAEYFDPGFTLFPMCHREIVDVFLALPEVERRSNSLQRSLIMQRWPELLDWPFNSAPRRAGTHQFVRRALNHAARWSFVPTSHVAGSSEPR